MILTTSPALAARFAQSTALPARPALVQTRREPGWDLLLSALAVYLLTAVGRVHQLFPLLTPLKPLLISCVIAIAMFFVLRGRRPGQDLRPLAHAFPLRCMAALLLWGLLSIPGALWVGGAFQMVVGVLLKAVLMAVILGGAVRGVGDVERLAGVYFASMGLYSVVVLARFDVGGDDWRLDKLYFYDANDFATIAITAIPIGIYFTLRARRIWVRVAAALGTAVVTTAFIWTGSRGGFVAALAVILFILVGYSTIPFRWRLGTLAMVVALVAGLASNTYWEKMQSLLHPTQDYNLASPEGRKAIWLRGIGYMLGHPILGVGAGNFPTAEGTISPRAARQSVGHGVKWQAAHNSYVQVGAELGIPGLVFFVAMIVSAWIGLFRRRKGNVDPDVPPDPRGRPLAQALAASLLGFAVGAFFLSLAYTDALYVLVAMAAGLRRITTW